MENVHGGNNGYTSQRYEAALRGNEYALINRGGVVDIAELYCSKPGNGTNGRAHVADAPTVPTIDLCVDELVC